MESVYGGPEQAALEGASAPAPDPAKVEAVGRAVSDLKDHLKARAAQHPDIADEFKEAFGVASSLSKRFAAPELGEAKQLGHVTETEARLVEGLVIRLARGRAHKELSYLVELAENLSLAVAAAAIA